MNNEQGLDIVQRCRQLEEEQGPLPTEWNECLAEIEQIRHLALTLSRQLDHAESEREKAHDAWERTKVAADTEIERLTLYADNETNKLRDALRLLDETSDVLRRQSAEIERLRAENEWILQAAEDIYGGMARRDIEGEAKLSD